MYDSDRARHQHGRARALLLVCATFAASLLFGCVPYELRSVLDGPSGKPLSVNPSTTVVVAGNSIGFTATGGVAPYIYAFVSGQSTGSIDAAGVFTAGLSSGTAVIRVTDKTGKFVDATVTVQTGAVGLAISPASITVSVGASVTFVPIGGSTPYAFAITTNNSGANPMAGAVYVAGPTPGVDDTVTLTDGVSATATATVHVVPVSSVDYAVTGPTFPGPGTVSSPLPGGWKFTLENNGTSTGTSADWKVYLSTNALLDGGDFVLASGTENGLAASGSVNKTVTGTFPAVAPGSYNIIVQVTSGDDTTPADNTTPAVPVTLNAQNINYVVSPVSNTGGTTAGAAMTCDFTIDNTGTADGSATVFWQVRASPDATLDPTDYIIAGGSITGGLPYVPPATTEHVSGNWPSTPGNWYLFALVIAVDDIDGGDVSASTLVNLTGVAPANVDYRVTVVSHLTGTVAGDPFSGTFDYTNDGTAAGIAGHLVYYTAYISADTTLQLGTDILIDSGSAPVLGPTPATMPQPFTGTWPAGPGTWHLIVSISSSDDVDSSNNITASVATVTTTAANIDYRVLSVNHISGTIAGGAFTGDMTIKNFGTHDGRQSIPLRVYISLNSALEIGTDVLISSGSIPAPGIAAGITYPTMPIAGTWPSSPGAQNYWLIVEVAAADDVDSSNNTGATAAQIGVAGAAPNYTITSVPLPAGTITGQAVNGSFTVQNNGNLGGGVSVTYQVYASLGNATYDAGDTLLFTSSFGAVAMSANASPDPTYSGTWPAVPGSYRIIVRLSAADDPSIPDASSGAIAVTSPLKPDYKATFSTAIPWSGVAGTAMNLTGTPQMTIQNLLANTGHQDLTWTVYLSLDKTLDVLDAVVQTATIPGGLAASGSSLITFGPSWPSAPGQLYFLIAAVQAADDANLTNDIIVAPHPCAVGDYRYLEGAEDNNGNYDPPPAAPPLPAAQTSNTGVTTLGANQTIAIEGLMDAYVAGVTQFDTYKFTTIASVNQLSMRAMWMTGKDDVDLYLWDTGTTNLYSLNTGIDAEPGGSTFDVTGVGARICYISANSWLENNTSGNGGQKYVILVRGLP